MSTATAVRPTARRRRGIEITVFDGNPRFAERSTATVGEALALASVPVEGREVRVNGAAATMDTVVTEDERIELIRRASNA